MTHASRPLGLTRLSTAIVLACMALVCAAMRQAPEKAPLPGAAQFLAQTADTGRPTLSINLATWLFAVTRHTPGQRDASVARLASWRRADMDQVLDELSNALKPFRNAGSVQPWSSPLALYGVTDPATLNLTLKRAAVLHADVAVFHRTEGGYDLPDDRMHTVVSDGRAVGAASGTFHWDAGRRLLDLVRPKPAADDDVRFWYRVAAGVLQESNDYSEFIPHLARARELFPRDAALALYAGTMHEDFAEPRVQNVKLGPGASASVTACSQVGCVGRILARPTPPFGPADHEWGAAETLFQEALQLDPDLSEARIRLAHVLAMRGRHEQAVTELQRALAASPPPLLRYFASVLLGREQHTLGRREAARAAYEEAVALYPTAQSPQLGLSQLARDRGDRPQALANLEVLGVPATTHARQDPWWVYNRIHQPDAVQLMAALLERLPR